MRKRLSLIAILLTVSMLGGCNGADSDTQSEAVTTKAPVGDFNFIAQGTPSSTGINDVQTTPEEVDPDDTEVSVGGEDNPLITTTVQQTEAPKPVETTPPDYTYVSPYEDLSSNFSIQIGEDVYVSVPSSILEKTCGLDYFLETYRLAHTLVNEEDYSNKSVVEATYKNGTCINFTDTSLYINALGIGYWCKNTQGSIDVATSPNISLFNLGELKSASGSMNARYSELGSMLDSEDNDYFYRAVYDIKDVEGTAIQARAILIFNKQTSAISTCVIYLNSEYCADTTANIDLLAGSVRYSTLTPDNLTTLV